MKTNLLSLFIILLAFGQVSATCITPALSSIALGLHTDVHLVECALGIFFAGFAFGVSFWGIIADTKGRRFGILAGFVLYVAATIFCALANNIYLFWLANFIQAFGLATASVVTLTALRDLCEEKERAHVFSIVSMALAFSPAVGPLLGTWLNTHYGWQAVYHALAVGACMLIMWSYKCFPETRKSAMSFTLPEFTGLIRQMLQDRLVLTCALLIGICNSCMFGFFAEAPFIFINHFGIDEAAYGWIGMCVSLAILVAGFLSRRALQRVSPETVIVQGSIVMALGALLYGLATCYAYATAVSALPFTLLLICCLFILFLGMGLIIPNCLSIALKAYSKKVGSAGSIFGCGYYIVIACLTASMSYFHTGTIVPLAAYLFVCTTASAILAYKLLPKKEPLLQ